LQENVEDDDGLLLEAGGHTLNRGKDVEDWFNEGMGSGE